MIIQTVILAALDGEQDYQYALFATMIVVKALIVKANKAINYVLFETGL